MWEQGRIFTTDIFSYTAFGNEWINHEWLSEIIYSFLYKHGGTMGLVSFRCLIGFLIGYLSYRCSFFLSANRSVSLLLSTLSFWLASPRFMDRPAMFSSLFFLCLLFLVIGVQSGSLPKKISFCFLGLFVLWVNLHGAFMLGLIFLFIFWFREISQSIIHFQGFSSHRGILFLLILGACLLNPYGYQIFLFPFQDLSLSVPIKNTIEWLSIFDPALKGLAERKYFPFVFLAVGLGLALNRKKLNIEYLLILGLMTCMAFRAVRFFSDFVLIAAPLLSGALSSWIPQRRLVAYLFFLLSLIFLGSSVASALKRGSLESQTLRQLQSLSPTYTPELINFLTDHQVVGRIFNDLNLAPSFIFLKGPQQKVFADGRHSVYGNDLLEKYYRALSHPEDEFLNLEDRYGPFDSVIIGRGAPLKFKPLQQYLWENPRWELVYFSNKGYIYLKKRQKFDSLITQYRIKIPPPPLLAQMPYLEIKD